MIFAIKPFEIHDGDGIRTTVFFKGCPLRCRWCHNPESLTFHREILYDSARCVRCLACTSLCDANTVNADGGHVFLRDACDACGKCETVCPSDAFEVAGREMTAQEIAEEVLRDALFLKASGGGVTFSGGEPLMQAALCAETAKLLKAQGIHIAVDTSGYVKRDALDAMIPYTDTFLFDIKAIDEAVHIACTGVSNRLILENLRCIDSRGIPIEIRYPYVPTMNDSEADAIGRFVRTLEHVKLVRVLPYHSYAQNKYACLGLDYPLPEVPAPTDREIETALNTIRAYGVKAERF